MMIFIPGNVPSSKNSKVWTGKFLVHSKATRDYIKKTKHLWKDHAALFKKEASKKSKPLMVGYHFVRGSKHKYDFVNPVQTVQDLMVIYGWLPDDNTEEMFPSRMYVDGKLTSYNKDAPGVYISIL